MTKVTELEEEAAFLTNEIEAINRLGAKLSHHLQHQLWQKKRHLAARLRECNVELLKYPTSERSQTKRLQTFMSI